jgi:hypothetical protein
VLDLLRLALRDLLAVVEDRHAVGDAHHDLHVVLDQEDGHVLLLTELGHEGREVRRLLGVHSGGGLVEEQELRLGGERPRDFEAPLVAVGEVLRVVVVLAP